MNVCGKFHDQKHITILLTGCICASTLFVLFLLHSYLYSLNRVSFVVCILFYLLSLLELNYSFHDAMLHELLFLL